MRNNFEDHKKEGGVEKLNCICSECNQEVLVGHSSEIQSGELVAKPHKNENTDMVCLGSGQPVKVQKKQEK